MPAISDRWQRAFKRQAQTDKQAYECLCRAPLPACHRLHYLQMFFEKLCKSHLWTQHDANEGEPDWVRSHAVIAKVLPVIVREHLRRKGADQLGHSRLSELRELCREVELLAPAVEGAGRRPDNCEYPWAAMDEEGKPVVRIPRDWDFRVENRLRTPSGRQLLKAAFEIAEE